MEGSCPATPVVLAGRDSKSPLQVAISSPESEGMKSPSRDSPDSLCVICLGRLQNKSFTDSCLHQFCFQCLLQWSKVKPECPLCKQPFKSIIHNVRSNLDYDQYHVEHGEPRCVLSDFMHSYNFDLIPVDRRFRYRSTMTREYFRELAESFLAHTRRLPEDSYQIHPLVPVDPAPPQNLRRSNRLHANSIQQRARQRGTSDFRRHIYTQDLWVQDLADISGRYRECTPQFYRENPAQIHRIIPWLNREVNVLLSDCESRAAYVLTRIVSILPQHSIRSREFRELVEPYFRGRTDHFIHELYTFAHSVYDIAGFDQNAVYGTNPNYATEVQEISSSNDDSDIEVLETVRHEDKRLKNISREAFKKILPKRGESEVKYHEPVAGPSGINSTGSPEPIEICESDPEEVKVLDYVKPRPEVVTLSSGEVSPAFSDLDASNGEYAEIIKRKTGKVSRSLSSSKEDVDKRKSLKGKCKSNGFGLKGRQKQKYIKSRKYRSSSSSSTSSFRNSSSSSSSTTESNYSSRSVSSDASSCSEYKSSSRLKKKKSKVSRKKYKKKISRKNKTVEHRRYKSGGNSDMDRSVKKRKVKSCVIVPDSKFIGSPSAYDCALSDRYSNDPRYENESPQSLASYWSIVSNCEKRKKRENSRDQKLGRSKRKYSSSSEDRLCKRLRDTSVSSDCSRESFSRKSEVSKSSKNVKSWSERVSDLPVRENSNSGYLSSAVASTSDVALSSSLVTSFSPSSSRSNDFLVVKPSSTISYVNSD